MMVKTVSGPQQLFRIPAHRNQHAGGHKESHDQHTGAEIAQHRHEIRLTDYQQKQRRDCCDQIGQLRVKDQYHPLPICDAERQPAYLQKQNDQT